MVDVKQGDGDDTSLRQTIDNFAMGLAVDEEDWPCLVERLIGTKACEGTVWLNATDNKAIGCAVICENGWCWLFNSHINWHTSIGRLRVGRFAGAALLLVRSVSYLS